MDKEVNDQADQLKRIFAEVEQNQDQDTRDESLEDEIDMSNLLAPKIDILNLPPRKEFHSNYQSRARLKIHRPLMRLLLIALFLIIIFVGGYLFYGEDLITIVKKI